MGFYTTSIISPFYADDIQIEKLMSSSKQREFLTDLSRLRPPNLQGDFIFGLSVSRQDSRESHWICFHSVSQGQGRRHYIFGM